MCYKGKTAGLFQKGLKMRTIVTAAGLPGHDDTGTKMSILCIHPLMPLSYRSLNSFSILQTLGHIASQFVPQ